MNVHTIFIHKYVRTHVFMYTSVVLVSKNLFSDSYLNEDRTLDGILILAIVYSLFLDNLVTVIVLVTVKMCVLHVHSTIIKICSCIHSSQCFYSPPICI